MKKIIAYIMVAALMVLMLPMTVANAATDPRERVAIWLNTTPDKWSSKNGLTAKKQGVGTISQSANGCTQLDGENIYFDIDKSKKFSDGTTFHNATPGHSFDIDICYWDEGYGGFYFQYDSYDGKKQIFVQCENTMNWRYARLTLYDAKFGGGIEGHDFKIITNDAGLMPQNRSEKSPEPVQIYWVKVYGGLKLSPFTITENTGKPGNVFFEGDTISIDMTYTNTNDVQYKNMRAVYSIYKPENIHEIFQWEEIYDTGNKGPDAVAYSNQTPVAQETGTPVFNGKNASDIVTFDAIPFGVYVMKIDITADSDTESDCVLMSKITDISYSKKAKPNYHYGINTHYDDYYMPTDALRVAGSRTAPIKGEPFYNLDEIKEQVDLLSNSGFGFVRTGVRWGDLQKQKYGAYTMPKLYSDTFQYAVEKGLKPLANLHLSSLYGTWDNAQHDIADTDIPEFKKYATFVANQLKKVGVQHYTVLNEFDLPQAKDEPSRSGSYDAGGGTDGFLNIDRNIKFAKAAYESIKAEQPNAWVNIGEIADDPSWQYGVPEPSWAGKWKWDTDWYQRGALNYGDSVSYHRYYQIDGPERIDNLAFAYWGKYNKDLYGYNDKEVWITEIGWPTREFENVPSARQGGYFDCIDEEKQANYYPRSLAIHAKDTVDMFMLYEFQDDRYEPFATQSNYGIVRARDYRTPFSPKPAYISTAAFNSLVGNEIVSAELLPGSEALNYNAFVHYNKLGYKYTNSDGEETYAVWCCDGGNMNEKFTINTGKKYICVYDKFGNVTNTVIDGSVTLTCRPDIQYVKGFDYDPGAPEPEFTVTQNGKELPDSVWYMENGKNIEVRFAPEKTFPTGNNIMLICAAYNTDDTISGVYTYEYSYNRKVCEREFNIDDDVFAGCNRIAFFVLEGETIRPLVNEIVINGFRDDEDNVNIQKNGDKLLISGINSKLREKEVSVTVLGKNTLKGQISKDTYDDYCIYQGQVEVGGNGSYSVEVTVPETCIDGAAVYISGDGYSTQRWID